MARLFRFTGRALVLTGCGLWSRSALAQEVQAQTIAPLGADATVAGAIAEPFEGAHSLGDWGYGLLLSIGAHWRDLPLSAGFEILAIHWGSATSALDIQLGDSLVRARESRQDQTIMLGPWLRLQPPSGFVRPYIEGVVGIKLLDTRYALSFGDDHGTTSTVSDSTAASNAGLGAGLSVLLAHASDDSGSALFMTLGVREVWGSRASFSRAPDASAVNQSVRFDVPTRSTLVLLGFSLRAQRKITLTEP